MQNTMKVTARSTASGNQRVHLALQRRNSRGDVYETINFTVERDEFDRAIDDAEMCVPWQWVDRAGYEKALAETLRGEGS